MARFRFAVPNPQALEYGSGTGPGALYLAERVFQVYAIDIIATATELVRWLARQRALDIQYGGNPYLPGRRHRKRSALRAALEDVGFNVMRQDGDLGGNNICTRSE